MTTLKTLEMALKALENGKRVRNFDGGTKYQPDLEDTAIAALRQQIALEKMAENERQLGIQMQPDEPVAYSVTWDDVHCGNFFFREQDAKEHKARLDTKYPGEHRKIVPLYTLTQPAPIQLRRGDILRCIETDELCTVWATSTTHKTLVKWSGNDFTDYTAEQIGELFWIEPESDDVEIAAEQSDNYAAFHAGVRFANTLPQPAAQLVDLTDEEIDKTFETQVWDSRRSYARAILAKLREKNTGEMK